MKKILLVFFLCIALCGCGRVTGTGTRIGTIIKVSDEGFFHKTHEIEIVRGGLNSASGGFGVKPFYATITNKQELLIANKFFDSQKEVEISYIEKLGTFWSSGCEGEDENCAYVVEIKEYQEKKQ